MNILPKTVFVHRMQDSDDYEWLSAEESANDCADPNNTRIVGVYELKEVISVRMEVKQEIITEKVK
jgi:hypothetical protein